MNAAFCHYQITEHDRASAIICFLFLKTQNETDRMWPKYRAGDSQLDLLIIFRYTVTYYGDWYTQKWYTRTIFMSFLLAVVNLHCYTLDFVLTRSKYCKLLYCYCCNLLYYYYFISTTGILVNIIGRYKYGVYLAAIPGGWGPDPLAQPPPPYTPMGVYIGFVNLHTMCFARGCRNKLQEPPRKMLQFGRFYYIFCLVFVLQKCELHHFSYRNNACIR